MTNKIVILFVEGDTEAVFYRLLFNCYYKMNNEKLACKYIIKNMKGIGSYKSKAIRIFKNEIIPKYRDNKIILYFCYDTDAFTYSKQPPVKWSEIRKAFIDYGIKVHFIKARESIEDWFLYDLDGILRYLNLPLSTNCSGKNGLDKLEKLFKKTNKVYIKGNTAKAFIEHLNIHKIMLSICSEISPLCRHAGLKCKSQQLCKRENDEG